jgi:hypothetical protein
MELDVKANGVKKRPSRTPSQEPDMAALRRLPAALALGAALSGPALAATADGQYVALGPGARTCADLMNAPKEVAAIIAVWSQGYFTALNQVMPDQSDVTGGRGDQAVMQEVYRSCQANGQMLIADAMRGAAARMAGPVKPAKAGKAPKEAPAASGDPGLRR